jgi:hypothetical protein
MQTIPSNYSVDSAGNRRNYQTIADSINSYSTSPSILTLRDLTSGSWEPQILTIAQSRAIPTGKYWISSLYKSQQSQSIDDIINRNGDLLLMRSMDEGDDCRDLTSPCALDYSVAYREGLAFSIKRTYNRKFRSIKSSIFWSF